MEKENLNKYKIAFVNDTFLEGRGVDTVIYELAKRLGKKCEVYVLAGETNIKEENFKFIKLNLNKLFTGKVSDFAYFTKMKKLENEIKQLQKKYNFNIFSVHHIGLSPAMNNFNTVYTWHGSPPTKNIFRKIVSKYFERKIKYQKIIFISKYMGSKFNFKGIVIPNGLSGDFKPSKEDKNFMLYVGRLEKHKNVAELIRLSKEIDFPLKIVGYGPEEENLRKLAKGTKVTFLGKVPRTELIKQYRQCSFFVSASKWEGFGLIFIEAAACSKPSIGYKTSAMPEVIIDKKTGFLAKDCVDFVRKAKIFKEDKFKRKKMGHNALTFSKEFNWDKVCNKYLEVFKK